MSSIIQISRSIWRAVVPAPMRERSFSRKLKDFAYQVFKRGAVYDADYYDSKVEGPAVRSAVKMSESIIKDLNPNTVVDVGCGTGALLHALKKGGCKVFGLEYSDAGLEYCRRRELDVLKFDIQNDSFNSDQRFDVAVSVEVAEHLPAVVADHYVSLLTSLSNLIVFTAAHLGQGGTDHVNEQPPSYWKAKFHDFGFEFDERLSLGWQETWKASGTVMGWYYENLMVFRKKEVA